ncbi:MAG: hypothetical protein Kow0092_26410 [Deferrisomatales bacterium]
MNTFENGGPRVVIACRIFEPELESIRPADGAVEVRYLDQSLHRVPADMPRAVQEQVEAAAPYASEIVLAYGLCSNGIVGVRAGPQGLRVPRVHDCIALFLGSRAAYERSFRERPGTYYLTPGWVAEKKDPIGVMEGEYTERVGRETAEWAIREELKHYTHIALIDTGAVDLAPLRDRARENARFLEKAYVEIPGRLDYLRGIVAGPYDDADFLFVKPGETITQDLFVG